MFQLVREKVYHLDTESGSKGYYTVKKFTSKINVDKRKSKFGIDKQKQNNFRSRYKRSLYIDTGPLSNSYLTKSVKSKICTLVQFGFSRNMSHHIKSYGNLPKTYLSSIPETNLGLNGFPCVHNLSNLQFNRSNRQTYTKNGVREENSTVLTQTKSSNFKKSTISISRTSDEDGPSPTYHNANIIFNCLKFYNRSSVINAIQIRPWIWNCNNEYSENKFYGVGFNMAHIYMNYFYAKHKLNHSKEKVIMRTLVKKLNKRDVLSTIPGRSVSNIRKTKGTKYGETKVEDRVECWATNEVGTSEKPCTFTFKVVGKLNEESYPTSQKFKLIANCFFKYYPVNYNKQTVIKYIFFIINDCLSAYRDLAIFKKNSIM